jgi:hypothetical protein
MEWGCNRCNGDLTRWALNAVECFDQNTCTDRGMIYACREAKPGMSRGSERSHDPSCAHPSRWPKHVDRQCVFVGCSEHPSDLEGSPTAKARIAQLCGLPAITVHSKLTTVGELKQMVADKRL